MGYYKLARPDGFDFHTGRTINYRDSIGQIVRPPNATTPAQLCTSAVLHASLRAEDCFQGASLPCSLYEIEGTPVCSDDSKAGFVEMHVLREIDPASHFQWRYTTATTPLNPLALSVRLNTTASDVALLNRWARVWDSVGASVRDSVRASVGDSVWDSVGASMRDSVWDSVGASVGASVWAYIGWIFAPVVTDWKYIKHRKGQYPFMASVRLWQRGLVPSYDGKTWRLHSGDKATIVYAG